MGAARLAGADRVRSRRDASKDGLAYEFVLHKGVKFHNGDPVRAEDVTFSLERYRGGAATTLKDRVAGVDVVDPRRVACGSSSRPAIGEDARHHPAAGGVN